MADNRQFTDHNEIGGVNVYLEDKKLAESPEQNTVASTDYVLLKDEDNIPRKISKANLMSVVKDAIGELLKSNDLGTSVTNVPALNESAFGSATISNLASVLGVYDTKIETSDRDFNTITSFGFYRSHNLQTSPNNPLYQTTTSYRHGFLIVYGFAADRPSQILVQTIDVINIWIRGFSSNGWSTWKKVQFAT